MSRRLAIDRGSNPTPPTVTGGSAACVTPHRFVGHLRPQKLQRAADSVLMSLNDLPSPTRTPISSKLLQQFKTAHLLPLDD